MVDIENEIWKETHLSPYYLVSNMGRVKSIERDVHVFNGKAHSTRHKKEHFLTPRDYHGYYRVGFNTLDGKLVTPLVHQLVMFAFKGIKKYPEWEIDHINGDSHDNRLENLEYVTSSENSIRALKLGLQTPEGMSRANWLRKITPEQVIEMKQDFINQGRKWGCRYNNSDFVNYYANKYNMKSESIRHILNGCTNKFFGEDIVQTTKTIYQKFIVSKDIFKDCKTFRDKCKIVANHFNLTVSGIESYCYHNKVSLEEAINYYNKKYSCNENCSSKG